MELNSPGGSTLQWGCGARLAGNTFLYLLLLSIGWVSVIDGPLLKGHICVGYQRPSVVCPSSYLEN